MTLKVFSVVPVLQLLFVGVIGFVALLEGLLLAFKTSDFGLGGGDLFEVVGHHAADQLVREGIEGRAGGFVVLYGVGDRVHPAVDHAGKPFSSSVLNSGSVSVHQVAMTPESLKRSRVSGKRA